MSTVPSWATGGGYPQEQSGTAPAVEGEHPPYPNPHARDDAELQASDARIDRAGLDSLLGADSEPEIIGDDLFMDGGNVNSSPAKEANAGGPVAPSHPRAVRVTTADLTFPTVGANNGAGNVTVPSGNSSSTGVTESSTQQTQYEQAGNGALTNSSNGGPTSVHASSDAMPQLASITGTETGQADVSTAQDWACELEVPQAPPDATPELVEAKLDRSSSDNPSDAAHSGSYFSSLLEDQKTPLADQLRRHLLDWLRRKRNRLMMYQHAYDAWEQYVAADDDMATDEDHETTEENLRERALKEQAAYTKFNNFFEKWKSENKCVGVLIDSLHEELKAMKEDEEKFATARDEFKMGLRGRPGIDHVHELAQYDEMMKFEKQARERERWRKRVETMKAVERICEAEAEAFDQERKRIAAEEERKKKEAEATAAAGQEVAASQEQAQQEAANFDLSALAAATANIGEAQDDQS
ncbi:hypothetical protein VTK56DRAFT_759 [Thermocarpiscus australiensis]